MLKCTSGTTGTLAPVPLVSVNLRLDESELAAIDRARPATVPRTWWIRGAIQQRLGWANAPQEPANVIPLPPKVPERG